ncbi:MAG TPA: hypothetical protein VLS88_18085 [Polyangiales bacterium]|nr:hypothetical protein [Polyangiales bacterium]
MNNVGRVLDSRWMMALAVLAVLVAIAWALLEQAPQASEIEASRTGEPLATVELLGVPKDAEVSLDGHRIENTVFGVSPGTRHAIEVEDGKGRSWRQVLTVSGSVTLVVELRTHFVEVEVPPKAEGEANE